eukprot:INCI4285.2.p1 GENE.INCI4285.2~~INCI4285.2.p1  ORF type:complete len:259 (-),score=34.03 INCI4285.2:947-1723(-)
MMPSVVAFLCFQGLLGVVRSAQPSFSPQVRVAFADFDACDTNTTARPCYMRSLHENLLPWARAGDSGGVTRQHIEAMRSVRDAQRLTFYKIVDGRLYRNNSQFEGLSPDWKGCFIGPRCEGIEHFLTTLLQRGASKLYRQLPDVEFFVNVRDTPTSPRHTRKTPELDSPLPIFSFSVADDGRFADIMYPNWAFQRGGPWLKELSAEDNHQLWDWSARLQDQLDAGGKVPWGQKRDVLFFPWLSNNRDPRQAGRAWAAR